MLDGTPRKTPSKYVRRVTKWEAAMARSGLTPELRRRVIRRDGGLCRYCGNKPFQIEIDHVYPVVNGGLSTIENLVTACRTCNQKKGWSRTWTPIPLDGGPLAVWIPSGSVSITGHGRKVSAGRSKSRKPSKKTKQQMRVRERVNRQALYVDNRVDDEVRRSIQKRDKPIW